jgi:CheY-like chemotaxis protein
MENLLCLLSNAVRYSQAGAVDVKVMLDGEPVKYENFSVPLHLRFEVWDTGIGLTSEAMSALFAPFKQAQRLAGGTGLGLFSLAKRVEALHGEYGVSARPDGIPGSLFWFSIPYRTDPMSAAAVLSPRGEIDGATFGGGVRGASPELGSVRARSCWDVLVVDDAPSILKMTTMLLTKKGHHVEQATNGAVALQRVTATLAGSATGLYDVVLMDLQMPVMDGVEAIRRIRAVESSITTNSAVDGYDDLESAKIHPEGRQMRQLIIALSANSDSDTMREALDAGADHFMSKPFTYDSFCDLMTSTKRIN